MSYLKQTKRQKHVKIHTINKTMHMQLDLATIRLDKDVKLSSILTAFRPTVP